LCSSCQNYFPISLYKSNISIIVTIASAPLLPTFEPALSIACSIVSVVKTPFDTGFPYFSPTVAIPFVASALM